MMKTDVYDRVGAHEMSRNAFYLAMGCILSWGLMATHIVSAITVHWRPTNLEILFFGLVIPLIGIFMSRSNSAVVSFVGFNLVVVPFGATLGPALATYELARPGIVSEAAMLTAMITGIMGVSGLLYPNFYRSIGGMLFGALIALVVVTIASLFIPALMKFTVVHYLAAGLFALYIGYDMWRASKIPATMDNAVDACISLYLDIINLFVQILEITGKRG